MSSSQQRVCVDCGAALPDESGTSTCARCLLEACFQGEDVVLGAHAPSDSSRIPPALAAPGEVFGDYELLEEIARGGMGVVFRARQRSLDRTVALKMMLSGGRSSRESVRRFRVEAEAASRLRHPAIVSIHEVGESEGQHFYSMDYIEGQDLVRRVQGAPVAPETAARWIRSVAEAIHHAHQHGILHRDLKPANVLIDAQDQPHVTDFGLAKLLDEARGLTATGLLMGTPSFMPPEQAGAEGEGVTVASDVYGLGAILYFLLAGKAPFEGKSVEHTLRMLLTEDPVPPSHQRSGIPRDLETICLKCLSKEPQRRYASAAELAEDLGAWSRREPIRARPVSGAERLWFWARRNPSLASVSAGLVVAIMVGAVLQQRALNEAWRARAAAEGLVQYMNEDLTEQLRPLGRLRLLDNVDRIVQRYYQGLPMNENPSDPQVGKARFYQNNAAVLRELGRLDEARESARSAIALLQSLIPQRPDDPKLAEALAEAHAEMRNILAVQAPADALPDAEETVRFCTLAAAKDPTSERAQAKLANARLELGSVLQQEGKTDQAAKEIRLATELLMRLPGTGTDAQERDAQLALCSYYQGLISFDQGDKAKAREWFGRYLDRMLQLAGQQKDPSDARVLQNVAIAHSHLGRALLGMNEAAEALQHFREYCRLAQSLERLDPGNVNYRRELGFGLDWLAAALERTGGTRDEITGLLTRSCDLFQKLAAEFPQGDVWQDHAARALTRLAAWHSSQNDTERARELFSQEVQHRWILLVKSSRRHANHRRFIDALDWSEDAGGPPGAAADGEVGRFEEWLARVAAEGSKSEASPEWNWTLATLHYRLAGVFAAQGKLVDARRELETALPIWTRRASERPDDAGTAGELAQAFCSLSSVQIRAGNSDGATHTVHDFVAWIQSRKGNPAGAGAIVKSASELQAKFNALGVRGTNDGPTALQQLSDLVRDLNGRSQTQAGVGP